MQRSRHIKFRHLICSILLAIFTIGTFSGFVIYKAPVTNGSSAEKNEPVKEKETEDKYFLNTAMPLLVCNQIAGALQPALLSFIYQTIYIEITPPPPDRV
jgi:hypothetical protein